MAVSSRFTVYASKKGDAGPGMRACKQNPKSASARVDKRHPGAGPKEHAAWQASALLGSPQSGSAKHVFPPGLKLPPGSDPATAALPALQAFGGSEERTGRRGWKGGRPLPLPSVWRVAARRFRSCNATTTAPDRHGCLQRAVT